MSESFSSPLARLVLFMVFLSVAGTVFAGIQYFAVDLPQQQAVPLPTNALESSNSCASCFNTCDLILEHCVMSGGRSCTERYNACYAACKC